jgi:hypothetical protein
MSSGHVADKKEIILNASTFDERSLAFGDNVPHGGREPHRQQLGKELSDTVDEADRPIVCKALGTIILRQKHNVGPIQEVQI